MILSKTVKIKIKQNPKRKHYEKLGYDISLEFIDVKIQDLPISSHIEILVKCDVCGKEKMLSYQKYIKNIKNCNFYACSSKCSQEKVKKTSKDKFGTEYYSQTDEYKKSYKETCLEKYGVEHHTKNNGVKEKTKETNLERYGVEYYTQTKEYKKSYKETCLEKYGVENTFQSNEIKEKIKETNLERYGVEHVLQLDKYKTKISENNRKQKTKYILEKHNDIKFNSIDYDQYNFNIHCDKCDKNFDITPSLFKNRMRTNSELCLFCNPLNYGHTSDKENKLSEFIKEKYNGEIIENSRNIISPYELDIYLPELNLAFEFNGVYWHNELNKHNNYHKEKSDLCEEKGIQLIHIWEDDWNYKEEIIKSMILNKLSKTTNKIFARKCEIKEIYDNKLIRKFLDKNHIQGFVGSSIKIGLFYNDELVSLMTFGKKRMSQKSSSKDGEYELLRFCNKLNTNVVGGASKSYKHFVKNYNPKEIITYADRSYSNGNLYETLGFNFVHKTEPNYYYVIGDKRYYRFNFRKDVLVKEGYDKNKSEHEIMLERKIYRIYNAGNYKFVYKKQ